MYGDCVTAQSEQQSQERRCLEANSGFGLSLHIAFLRPPTKAWIIRLLYTWLTAFRDLIRILFRILCKNFKFLSCKILSRFRPSFSKLRNAESSRYTTTTEVATAVVLLGLLLPSPVEWMMMEGAAAKR